MLNRYRTVRPVYKMPTDAHGVAVKTTPEAVRAPSRSVEVSGQHTNRFLLIEGAIFGAPSRLAEGPLDQTRGHRTPSLPGERNYVALVFAVSSNCSRHRGSHISRSCHLLGTVWWVVYNLPSGLLVDRILAYEQPPANRRQDAKCLIDGAWGTARHCVGDPISVVRVAHRWVALSPKWDQKRSFRVPNHSPWSWS